MEVCEHIFDVSRVLYIGLCLFISPAAPCLSNGFTDCLTCGSRLGCSVGYCNCYSDCYEYGDCCPDVAHVDNCLGECVQ